jgi:hypothetical protein
MGTLLYRFGRGIIEGIIITPVLEVVIRLFGFTFKGLFSSKPIVDIEK